ncbi:hypothetical protein THAOC_10126 [Thalassiosira oceanica]|uniref:Uncharacterized protein n=1 Tax=Thalassiosira oceanica TaxID=159749 RepID=K0SR00_THAOC|nr:hypothetical protein THAOC_10126 [Thalassiosira oceanica]|eukprot:EJK68673.1 hypothetical protein THAOC_10126 [Thalassiosira oceanica]
MVLYNVDSKEEFGDCQTLGEVAGPGARVVEELKAMTIEVQSLDVNSSPLENISSYHEKNPTQMPSLNAPTLMSLEIGLKKKSLHPCTSPFSPSSPRRTSAAVKSSAGRILNQEPARGFVQSGRNGRFAGRFELTRPYMSAYNMGVGSERSKKCRTSGGRDENPAPPPSENFSIGVHDPLGLSCGISRRGIIDPTRPEFRLRPSSGGPAAFHAAIRLSTSRTGHQQSAPDGRSSGCARMRQNSPRGRSPVPSAGSFPGGPAPSRGADGGAVPGTPSPSPDGVAGTPPPGTGAGPARPPPPTRRRLPARSQPRGRGRRRGIPPPRRGHSGRGGGTWPWFLDARGQGRDFAPPPFPRQGAPPSPPASWTARRSPRVITDLHKKYKRLIGLSPVLANAIDPNATPFLGRYAAVSVQTWTAAVSGNTLGSSTRRYMVPKDDNAPTINDLRRPFFRNWRQTGERPPTAS